MLWTYFLTDEAANQFYKTGIQWARDLPCLKAALIPGSEGGCVCISGIIKLIFSFVSLW